MSWRRRLVFFSSLVVLLLFTGTLGSQDESSHFGFRYFSTFNECLQEIANKYGRKVKVSFDTRKEIGTEATVSQIIFKASFSGHSAINLLTFTPISKKLYEISHTIVIKDSDALSKAEYFMVLNTFRDALNKKYGLTKPERSERNRLRAEHTVTLQWLNKDKSLQVDLFAIYDLSDTPNNLTLTYTNKAAEKLKIKEQTEIDKKIQKDL